MIKTKIARAAGFGAVAIIAALSFTVGLSAPTPAEARVFVGFGFGFPIGFPFYYPPYPYPQLSAATAALLPRPGLLPGTGAIISAAKHLCSAGIRREPVDNLHAAARLD